jgi:hypothetical protein
MNKMRGRYKRVGTVPASNRKTLKEAKSIPLVHDHTLS